MSLTAQAGYRSGDVLLQPLHCYLCSMIEAEENSIYSHVGVVVIDNGEVKVVEAYKSVNIVSLEEFLSKTEPGQKVLHLRSVQSLDKANLLDYYFASFHGLPYDPQFSLDDEKIYCSELVLKLLNPFLSVKIPTKKMHFNQNRSAWESYFRGKIPDGKLGIAPADFLRSELFSPVTK